MTNEANPSESKEQRPLIAVTGSQQPYIFDLPHLLSLPNGFEFRFRYRHRWIEKGILRNIKLPHLLRERDLIICFHSQESRLILPIRTAKIISVEDIGPMVLLRFRVAKFAKVDLDLTMYHYPDDPDNPDPIAAKAREYLAARAQGQLGVIPAKGSQPPNVISHDMSKSLPDGWYLRESQQALDQDEWDPEGDTSSAWTRLVAVLQSERNLFGVPFFHVLGFRNEIGETVAPSGVANRFSPGHEEIYGFKLSESERYRMRVLEWCERPWNAPPPRIRLSCDYDKTQLSLEGSSNLIAGRYDVVEHTFVAQRAGYSEVVLRAESLDDSKKSTGGAGSGPEATTATTQEPAVPTTATGQQASGSPQTVAAATQEQAIPTIATGQQASAIHAQGPDWVWKTWPAIFVARVPVVVKPKKTRYLIASILVLLGLALYVWVTPNFEEKSTGRRLFELLTLGIMFLGYKPLAEPLERLLKIEESTKKVLGKSGDKKD